MLLLAKMEAWNHLKNHETCALAFKKNLMFYSPKIITEHHTSYLYSTDQGIAWWSWNRFKPFSARSSASNGWFMLQPPRSTVTQSRAQTDRTPCSPLGILRWGVSISCCQFQKNAAEISYMGETCGFSTHVCLFFSLFSALLKVAFRVLHPRCL